MNLQTNLVTKACFIAIFLIINVSFSTTAQIDTTSLQGGYKFQMQSKALNSSVEAWLRLPYGFDKGSGEDYSLLVLLDGDEYFKMASDVAELYEWSDKMASTVIVGLPSTAESRWKYYTPSHEPYAAGKMPDDSLLWSETGNLDKYADFVSKELIPDLEAFLGVRFQDKTLFGHSMGGLAAMSFFTFRPEIFQKYIAASPSLIWDDHLIVNKLLEKKDMPQAALYMTAGISEKSYMSGLEAVSEKLISQQNVKFTFVKYESDKHSTTGLRSLLDGLAFVNETESDR